jgi:hypothetical protein
MGWTRTLAMLAATLALAGCYETRSDVAAVSDVRRLAKSPIAPGIWCSADVTFDTADAVTALKLENCFNARFEAGILTVEKLHPDDGDSNDEPVVFVMAALNRGTTLLQIRSEVDKRYELYVAKISKDGIAVLPELKLTPRIIADATAAGVTIERKANVDRDAKGEDLGIRSGEPDAVLKLIDHAVGFRFDDAVRDRVLSSELMTKSMFFLRLEADPKKIAPDPAQLTSQLERLRTAIRFAMTLE